MELATGPAPAKGSRCGASSPYKQRCQNLLAAHHLEAPILPGWRESKDLPHCVPDFPNGINEI